MSRWPVHGRCTTLGPAARAADADHANHAAEERDRRALFTCGRATRLTGRFT